MFLYNTASRILFVNKLSVDLVFNIHSGIKKLFKFLKKYSYRSRWFRRFLYSKIGCFFLFCGYIARYAPLKYK